MYTILSLFMSIVWERYEYANDPYIQEQSGTLVGNRPDKNMKPN